MNGYGDADAAFDAAQDCPRHPDRLCSCCPECGRGHGEHAPGCSERFVTGLHEQVGPAVGVDRRRLIAYLQGFAAAECTGREVDLVEEICERIANGEHTRGVS